MNNKEIKQLLKFFIEADKLKDVPRAGWKRVHIKQPESVADHSWSTAVISYVIAKRLGLNANKAALMGLIHDMGEVYIGDFMPHEISAGAKLKKERTAIGKMFRHLGPLGKELLAVWHEFEHGKSPEGRLVKELDKFDADIRALQYEKAQKCELSEFYTFTRSRVTNKLILRFCEEVERLRPKIPKRKNLSYMYEARKHRR